MAEFPNFRRKYSPSALMQGVQQQNQQRYMSPLITPNVGMGNAQGRNSALAPAAGMSTSNPTGAQTAGPAVNTGYQFTRYIPPAEMSQNNSPQMGYDRQSFIDNGNQYNAPVAAQPPQIPLAQQSPVTTPQSQAPSMPVNQVPPTSPAVPVGNQAYPSALGGGSLAGLPRRPSQPIEAVPLPENAVDQIHGIAKLTRDVELAGRGEGWNAQAGRLADANNYERAYGKQQSALQQGQGITPDMRANWTPETGYGFAPSAVQGAVHGGAIGAGMRGRFGQGGYFNPSDTEEDTGPKRSMTDDESLTKMGITHRNEQGQLAITSEEQQARESGDTAKADMLKAKRDAIIANNDAQRKAWIERGGKTSRELRREKRAASALASGRITKEEYNNVVTANDERVERRSAGFAAEGALGAPESALASTVVPNNAVTGSSLPRPDVQQKAIENMKVLTDPNTVMAPANTPQDNMQKNEAAAIQGLGITAEDSLLEMNRKVTTMSNDNVRAMLADKESTRAFIAGLKRAYTAQKNSMGRDQFKKLVDDPTAKHWEALESMSSNDPEAAQKWWSKLYHDAEKKRRNIYL